MLPLNRATTAARAPLDAVFQLHTELWREERLYQLSYPFYSPSQRPERGA
jgi:hypothetical protein